jgi:platelet-activating factor acetylhydrolase IB subunit beta/gamma
MSDTKPNWSVSDVANYLEEDATFIPRLRAVAKYKERSYTTSKTEHIPLLERATKNAPNLGPTVVLLGDSMLERMTTTDQSPNFTELWPSSAMLPDETLDKWWGHPGELAQQLVRFENVGHLVTPFHRIDRVFNAGVGGDKIQNLAYRLAGDPEKDLPGLLPILAWCGTVRLWVVHIGSNNLTPKRALTPEDLYALEVLVDTLAMVGTRGVRGKVLLTGILDRTDVPKNLVAKANQDLKSLWNILSDRWGPDRVYWYAPACWRDLDTTTHLDDHVHLNLAGYRWWMESFFLKVVLLLETSETEAEMFLPLPDYFERRVPWFADRARSDQGTTRTNDAAAADDDGNDNATTSG